MIYLSIKDNCIINNGPIHTSHIVNGKRKTINIFRLLYLKRYGNFEDNIRIKHSCKNTNCININHLYNCYNLEQNIEKNSLKNKNGCIIWQNRKTQNGYGEIRYNGKTRRLHRVVYEYYHNIKLKKLDFICHSCDNPLCVNIDHLWLGLPLENSKDMTNKNRQAKGIKIKNSKINSEVAKVIKYMLKNYNYTYSEIANKTGASKYIVASIKRNCSWKHVEI